MSFAAILSAGRASADAPASLRASLYFAGQTLVEYQARQAVRAGADRVLILVGVITPALSQAVDRLSADGIAVALVRDMVSMVRDAPRDRDVLLLADGAIVAQAHLDQIGAIEGDALLVADDGPASTMLERIDAGQRWAGAARFSPSLLFGTLDMIGDWDLSLTLVRAAVQKGARRLTVSADELMEGRVAIVETQEQADLVARAVTSTGMGGASGQGGLDLYLIDPIARIAGPALMRMQVPALQMSMGGIALAAVALVPVMLQWPLTGFCLLLAALIMVRLGDRLDQLALRQPPSGWLAFAVPGLTLAGIVLALDKAIAFDLALLLGILVAATRWGRTGAAKAWMILTPAAALILLILGGLGGLTDAALRLSMLLAVASAGAIILHRPN